MTHAVLESICALDVWFALQTLLSLVRQAVWPHHISNAQPFFKEELGQAD